MRVKSQRTVGTAEGPSDPWVRVTLEDVLYSGCVIIIKLSVADEPPTDVTEPENESQE